MTIEFKPEKIKKDFDYRYIQTPTVLLESKLYQGLSIQAILAYSFFRARFYYSAKNQFVDQQKQIYFIYENKELAKNLKCCLKKVIDVKRELEEVGLLKQVKRGFDRRTKQNLPNMLYLGELVVGAKDIYRKDNNFVTGANFGSNKQNEATTPKSEKQSNKPVTDKATTADCATPQKHTKKSEQASNNDKIVAINAKKPASADLDFSNSQYSSVQLKQQERLLLQNSAEMFTGNDYALPLEAKLYTVLGAWATNTKQVHRMVRIILNAKNDASLEVKKRTGYTPNLALDNNQALRHGITNTFMRFFTQIKLDKKQINNYENYLYKALRNYFEFMVNKQGLVPNNPANTGSVSV